MLDDVIYRAYRPRRKGMVPMSLARRTTATVAALALALGGALVGTSPATAGNDHDNDDHKGWLTGGSYYEPPAKYDDRYQFTEECDDLTLKITGRARGVFSIRNIPGTHGQAFLAKDRYFWFEKVRIVGTGEWFTAQGRGVFQEHAAKRGWRNQVPDDAIPPEGLIGPLYWFLSSDRGTLFWVKDSEGRTIGKDRGLLVFKELYDTLGDHQPGATFLTGGIVKQVGHFPLFDSDFCTIAEDLVK